jgi:hypothetical protein
MTGVGGQLPPSDPFDFDGDRDSDMVDFADLQVRFGSP